MSFTSPAFLVFFLLFFWLWPALRGRPRQLFLLAASYLFYASWSAPLLLLLIGSTLLDFSVARAIGRSDDPTRRRRLLALSVAANLGVLAGFKYASFFVDSAALGLHALGLDVGAPTLAIVLPVGISFYTFQTLGYTVDVYRRRLAPCASPLDFALYVAYFPQLVAGPIERAGHLLPQLQRLADPTPPRPDLSGFALIALGAFKKVVLADNLAPIVDAVYADPGAAWAPALWFATYAFAFQIYCDFSGYSDIAVGVARLRRGARRSSPSSRPRSPPGARGSSWPRVPPGSHPSPAPSPGWARPRRRAATPGRMTGGACRGAPRARWWRAA